MASYRDVVGALEALCRMVRVSPSLRGGMRTGALLEACEALTRDARRGLTGETPWTAFEPAMATAAMDDAALAQVAERFGVPFAAARAIADEELKGELFVNSRYQVVRREVDADWIYLSVKRLDQQPIRSWRDLQRIKTELVGAEAEGIELYPSESRVLDTANQYHLWVSLKPLSFGFHAGRHVHDDLNLGEGQAPLGGA